MISSNFASIGRRKLDPPTTFDVVKTLAMLIGAVLIWAWLGTGLVGLVFPLSREKSVLVYAGFAGGASLMLFLAFLMAPEFHMPERNPVPCYIDSGRGIDVDIRDGLCYRDVPPKYKRRSSGLG
jgi:hypothetical protein